MQHSNLTKFSRNDFKLESLFESLCLAVLPPYSWISIITISNNEWNTNGFRFFNKISKLIGALCFQKRDENSQLEMLEGAKSMGAGAATIALAGVAVGIGNVFRSFSFYILLLLLCGNSLV